MEHIKLVVCDNCHNVRIMRSVEQAVGKLHETVNLWTCNICNRPRTFKKIIINVVQEFTETVYKLGDNV